MLVWIRAAGRIAALQEFLLLFFFRPLGAALRVVLFHVFLFLWGQFGQMAYEEDQFPTILVLPVRFTPSWHSAEAYAVVDDVVDLSVRQILRCREAHVGCLRVEILADRRGATAVVPVADGAVVGK